MKQTRPPLKYFLIIIIIASVCAGLAHYLKLSVGAIDSGSVQNQTHTFGGSGLSNLSFDILSTGSIGEFTGQIDNSQNIQIQEMQVDQIQAYLQQLKQKSDQLADYYYSHSSGSLQFAQDLSNYMDQYYGD